MRYLLIILFSLLSVGLFAQDNSLKDTTPLYKQFPDIPPFSIYQYPDSNVVTKSQLKKKKEVLMMIFSPDCDHCKHATEDMLSNMKDLKDVQIIMITSLKFEWIKPFYYKYNLYEYKNIIVGYQSTYFLNEFYDVTNYPSIFVYNKQGKLKGNFDGNVPFKTIIKSFK